MFYVHVAAGDAHTVLLRSDGAAMAFGSNDDGQCDVPDLAPGMQYVHAATRGNQTILLRSDGAAMAFGRNGHGQCDVPELPPGMKYVHAAPGMVHSVLLRSDGAALAFGCDDNGQCDVEPLPCDVQYVHAQAGSTYSVVLRSDGAAMLFGENAYGLFDIKVFGATMTLGDNDDWIRVPHLPSGMLYVYAAAGSGHCVLLRSDGDAIGFGDNSEGACRIPHLPPGMQYVYAAAGSLHSILLRSDGAAIAFGNNLHGQCDIGEPLWPMRIDLPPVMLYVPTWTLPKLRLWSTELHAQFPVSSRAFVKLVLLLDRRMKYTGKAGLAPMVCLLQHVLPLAVPMMLQGWWASPQELMAPAARPNLHPTDHASASSSVPMPTPEEDLDPMG